jgi:hypothetical protein
LASGRSEEKERELTAEALELNRDVLSAVAHELGGIAGALDLRATAMSATIPDQDLAALRGLAEELRMATRSVRFARGADGFGALNPTRPQTLADWWKFAARFTSVVLPRGITVESRFSGGQLNAAAASGLTWLWLAACKEAAERGIVTPCTVVLNGESGDKGSNAVTVVAEVNSDRFPSGNGSASRWVHYAARVAEDFGVTGPSWERAGSVMRWRCTLDG